MALTVIRLSLKMTIRCLYFCLALHLTSVKAEPWDRWCEEGPEDDYSPIRTPQARLLKMLLDNYGPKGPRPVLNQSDAILVGLEVKPSTLVKFEEQSQLVTIKSHMMVRWVDEQLVWDPADHEGVKSVSVSTDDIWIPDLTIPESTGESFDARNNMVATVDYKGNIEWYSVAVTSTFCKLLVRYFPFDVQHCNITYISWLYDVTELATTFVNMASEEEVVESFEKNGMWELTGLDIDDSVSKACADCGEYSYITFTLELERKESSFFMLNVIVPCVLLSMMNLLVFFLPPESGEKISFVMTNVLTLVLFQQLVATMLPASGDDTPLLSTHIVTLIMFGCIAIVWTVFVTYLYYKTTPFPKWLYSIFTSFRCLYRRTQFGKLEAKARKAIKAEHGDDLEESADPEAPDRWYTYKGAKRRIQSFSCWSCGKESPPVAGEARGRRKKKPRLNFDPEDQRLWQETANLLDRCMGYLMITCTIVIYTVLLWNFLGHDPKDYHISTQ